MRYPTHRDWCQHLDIDLDLLDDEHRICLTSDECQVVQDFVPDAE